MNQAEILTLMRTDLEAVGIEPDKYFGLDAVPLSFTQPHIRYSGPYGALLVDWLGKCSYQTELISHLYKFAIASGQRHSTFGAIIISQAMHQAATKRITLDEFFERLLQAMDTRDFMTRLLAW